MLTFAGCASSGVGCGERAGDQSSPNFKSNPQVITPSVGYLSKTVHLVPGGRYIETVHLCISYLNQPRCLQRPYIHPRDDALLYIAYVMLIWAAPIPADRWHCSL